jgi:hypothetical protein
MPAMRQKVVTGAPLMVPIVGSVPLLPQGLEVGVRLSVVAKIISIG